MQSCPDSRVPWGSTTRPPRPLVSSPTSQAPASSSEMGPSFTGKGSLVYVFPPGRWAPCVSPISRPSCLVMVSTAPAGHAWGAGSLRIWAPGQPRLAAAATASSTLAPGEPLPFFSACEPGAFFFMRVVPERSVTVVTGAEVSAFEGAAPVSASGGFQGGATSWTCVSQGVGSPRKNSVGKGDVNTGWPGDGGGVGAGGVGRSWSRKNSAPTTSPTMATATRSSAVRLTRVRSVGTVEAAGSSGGAGATTGGAGGDGGPA